MAEPTKINVSVANSGHNRGRILSGMTLDKMIGYIRAQGLDDYTTNGLIDLASRYPTAALNSFRRNINVMIQRVRSKRRKETETETDERIGQLHMSPISEVTHKESRAVQQDQQRFITAANIDEAFDKAFTDGS